MLSMVYAVMLVSGAVLGIDEVTSDYLSDIVDERVFYHTQGWGELGIDTAVKPTDGRAPMSLRVKDSNYEKGLGHHAPGEIVVELGGDFTAFSAEVGVQWQGGTAAASVVFQVYVDDQLRFDSGVMKEQDEPRRVGVSLKDAQTLRLAVTDAGDGIICDCADWANARLVRVFGAKAKHTWELVDVAPFARVVTWDPHRMDGAKSNRVQEFLKEDVFLDTPVRAGDSGYTVPAQQDGLGCIGLQWAETRLVNSLAVEFPEDGFMPPTEGVQVQYWTGESPWQGAWKTLKGEIQSEKNRWTLAITMKENGEFPRTGVDKIRWVFPGARQPIVVKQLAAYTRSRWDTAVLRFESETVEPGKQASIEAYNGVLVECAEGGNPYRCTWDLAGPVKLTVRYTKPKPWKSDRTVLRIHLPQGSCGVAVEDVVKSGCVYVRDLGLYVAPASTSNSLADYRKSIEGRKTVLARVREMPDQTLAQAIEKTHNPIQDIGPMLVSLACDNHKIIAHRDGAIQFDPCGVEVREKESSVNPSHRLTPQFGSGKNENLTRKLRGEWLPAPETSVREGDVVYTQCTYVAPTGDPVATAPVWLNTRPLCVAEFQIENTGDKPADVSLRLALAKADKTYTPEKVEAAAFFAFGGQLLAYVDASGAQPLQCESADGGIVIKGSLPAHATAYCCVQIPEWAVSAEDFKPVKTTGRLFEDFKGYWERALADAARVDVPDPLLANVIKASQVHCLIAAHNEQDGVNVAAWIASDRYGPLESEAHSVILGMDSMGQTEFARRSLDYFIKRYNAQGYLTTGYTMMGTGWHLWTLARHYALTADRAWFEKVASEVARVCQWIAAQRDKTKLNGADLEETPEHGLMPPGVGADWNRFAYRFAIQAHYCAGLRDAALALSSVNNTLAPRLLEYAKAFQEDIVRAYRWNQARSPVLALSDGSCVPAYGGMLYGFGTTGEMIPGEDGNRSWAYDVELGSHHLIPLGILDANSADAAGIMDHMEDEWFLKNGMGDYPEDKNRADGFNFGGFSKVQPFYTRNAEICAMRDDVKPFIRSYFNAMAAMLSRENLSFWEHFYNTGAWNKTHETGWFLVQTSTMFATEHGNELWLAPFLTNAWMEDGKTVAVEHLPTPFGPVSYRIVSSVDKGYIEATVDPPKRSKPERVVVRLRHPKGLPIQSVTINGAPHTDFDPAKECVYLGAPTEKITVRAQY